MKQQVTNKHLLEEDRIGVKMSEQASEEKQNNRLARFSANIPHKLAATMDCIRCFPSTCANMKQVSSRQPAGAHSANASLLRRMCAKATLRGAPRGRRRADASTAGQLSVDRLHAKRSTASYTREGLFGPTLLCLLIMMAAALAASLVHATSATSAESGGSLSADAARAQGHESKPNSNERVDSLSSKPDVSPSSSPAQSSEKSIVASLSSAVATAAAAAAVAAAQNSLSSSDARSLASGSHHRHHVQAQRSPGLNLAIKLVDTIPEVPYNILHNMKKLDHAAPFYNVPNKITVGATKESSQSLLSSALASGNLGGAAEQLAAIFRSPLWKRISDGYGEFASEFRSRFRPPGATPMKGPSSSTSKLLRDISVPALLMLLASSVSGADWRPVRTRRKSFRPVDIRGALPAGPASSLAFLIEPTFKDSELDQGAAARQQWRPHMDPMLSEPSASSAWIDRAAAPIRAAQADQHAGSIARLNEAHLQPAAMDISAANGWLPSQASGAAPSALSATGVGQDQNQQYYTYTPALGSAAFAQAQPQPQGQQQQQQQQQAVKRSGEIIATDSEFPNGSASAAKQAASQQRATLFSPLTSDLALGQAKLMSKLFNANVARDGNAYRLMSLADGLNRLSPIKRDQLSDKQRYSLIEPAASADSHSEGGANEQSWSTRPFALSAIGNAVASLISAHPPSSESGSLAGQQQQQQQQSGKATFFSRAGLQSLIGDKTINHSETFARRQPQQATNMAEQRDLSKLLPESWREVVKRTMSTVQQQANVQWKSIEGQLTNWVQGKLKTVAAGASGSSSASSSASGASSSSAPAPIANVLASMSSTALNILGLNKNTNSTTHSHSTADHQATSTAKVDKASALSGSDSNSANQRGKLEKKASVSQQAAGGALAGVASVLVKTLTNRQSSSPATPSSPLSPPPKPSASDSTSAAANGANDVRPQAQSLKVGDSLGAASASSSSSGSVASQYPTLTGAQADSQGPTKESSGATSGAVAAASSASQANVHNTND